MVMLGGSKGHTTMPMTDEERAEIQATHEAQQKDYEKAQALMAADITLIATEVARMINLRRGKYKEDQSPYFRYSGQMLLEETIQKLQERV